VLSPTSKKRSVTINGHRTSITLEPAFWDSLNDIARNKGKSVSALIAAIDKKQPENLSSAIRIFVLEHYKRQG
jgi:predicted DNA-binding ribbon-helix-helix protein